MQLPDSAEEDDARRPTYNLEDFFDMLPLFGQPLAVQASVLGRCCGEDRRNVAGEGTLR